MWQTVVNYIYVGMLAGFGLAMGISVFISFMKTGAWLIEHTVLKLMGYRKFSYASKIHDKVRLGGKSYLVNSIVENQNKTHKTYYLTGLGYKNPDISLSVYTVNNKGA